MAITKTVEINVESQKAEKNIKDLNKQFENLGVEAVDSIKKIEKGVDNTEKSTKSLASGFKSVGLAIKAMGIGLVLEAFNILGDLFRSNQKIADAFGTSIKALGIVFNDLFNFIFSNASKVTDFFKGIFEDPIGSIKELGNLIKENLIERFVSLLEVSGFLADAFKSLFEGDFKGALNSVKEAGKEMADVFTGIDDTTGKISNLADQVGKYASNVLDSAEALQKQENAAKLAVAQQQRLVEQYDREAEKLRQIRDNDLISIEERQKANDELGKVLDQQEKAMLGVAAAQIAQAQNQLRLNNTIENQVELTNALANREAILAQIEGFRSEQIVNKISLEKESLDLAKSRQQTETEIAINQKLFEAERLRDEEAKLLAQKEAIENQRLLELQRLQDNINLYKEGTQARVDAENEFALKKQELDNALIAKDDEILAFRENKRLTDFQRQFENENMTYGMRLTALQAYNQAVLDSETLTAEQKDEIARKSAEYERMLKNQQLDMLSQYMGDASQILGEQSKAGKAFAVAQALINTYKGISNVWAEKSEAGFVGAGLIQRIATTAIVAAQGFKTVKNILAVNPMGASAATPSGASGAGGAGTPPPQFNIVGGNVANQIGQVLGNQPPVQAFVVGSQVTSQQAMDRNIITNASLG